MARAADPELRTVLEDWCASYVAAFSTFDVPAIARHWTFPATVVLWGKPGLLADADAFITNTERLCGFYRAQGVAMAERSVREVLLLAPGSAAIQVDDVMRDSSGTQITGWSAGYLLCETGEGWRACSAVADGEMDAWATRGTPLIAPRKSPS